VVTRIGCSGSDVIGAGLLGFEVFEEIESLEGIEAVGVCESSAITSP
jgi:hypothetical protein